MLAEVLVASACPAIFQHSTLPKNSKKVYVSFQNWRRECSIQIRMVFVIKIILIAFMIFGVAITLYGAWEIMGTLNFVNASPGRAKAKFVGYHHEIVETRSTSPSPNWPGQVDFYDSTSIMSYPQFEYVTKDGQIRQIQESKIHVFERFKRGQEVEIVLSPHPYQDPRLAGFYSLYFSDLCIFTLGCCFILIPCLIWKLSIPLLESTAGIRLVARLEEWYRMVASTRVGPVLELAEDLPSVQGERILLEQVVFNLARNALDALLAQSGVRRVKLKTSYDSKQVYFEVSDMGPVWIRHSVSIYSIRS